MVTGPNGPEAGVWVIAETTDLPTKFAKIVVTDDRGRYRDSRSSQGHLQPVGARLWAGRFAEGQGAPGKLVDLTAVPAPTAAAAAEYYPGVYWYSMLKIPDKTNFPAPAPMATASPSVMKTQHYWIDTLKNSCQSCHALGSKGVRTILEGLGDFENSTEAWTRRAPSPAKPCQHGATLCRLGPKKALSLFADWTDRIAAGELPFAKPERPQGIERNVVISMWEWASPKLSSRCDLHR